MSARECPGCGLTVRTPDDADRDDDARLCPDGRCHGTDALSRVRASRAGGYSTLDLDPRDVDAVLSALDAAEVAAGHQRTRAEAAEAECARLRAIVEGRTVAPTDAEIAAHERAGGRWRCALVHLRGGHDWMDDDDARAKVRLSAPGTWRWWPLDASGRPCPWPVTP